ncbi:hypothetical protein E2C01_055721 [Portunus trituberculatus]|uniref:Uncharacterized protein n=1 Tax=Portunus trituberculatus TaxID=210409 RepID=A0A5B7GWR1_PORTR|nr:hypothetical protein [Portunus trituberculatus]
MRTVRRHNSVSQNSFGHPLLKCVSALTSPQADHLQPMSLHRLTLSLAHTLPQADFISSQVSSHPKVASPIILYIPLVSKLTFNHAALLS